MQTGERASTGINFNPETSVLSFSYVPVCPPFLITGSLGFCPEEQGLKSKCKRRGAQEELRQRGVRRNSAEDCCSLIFLRKSPLLKWPSSPSSSLHLTTQRKDPFLVDYFLQRDKLVYSFISRKDYLLFFFSLFFSFFSVFFLKTRSCYIA